MPAVAPTTALPGLPEPKGPPEADTPAGDAFTLIFTTTPALLRLTVGLVGAVVAVSVRTPPVVPPLLFPATVILASWSVWYARRALRRGFTTPLVSGDVALTSAACLATPVLVAPEVLPGEVSWIAVLASTTVINAQATAPARWSIPAGLLVTAAYAVGVHTAGNPREAVAHTATLLVQTGIAAAITAVMRRRITRADHAFAKDQRLARQHLIARTARDAERRQNRNLHDTVLATLTVVGLGAGAGPALRERCSADLSTLSALVDRPPANGPVALDARLRTVLSRLPGLAVTADLAPCTVPVAVAEAVAESVAAALSNVALHAPTAATVLRLTQAGGAVVVEVVDDGPGFEPATVPTHRYGIRESICGRMVSVGGRAQVHSRPGAGTRIRLEWSDVC